MKNKEIKKIIEKAVVIIESRKVITAGIKKQLMDIGFRESVIGTKEEHNIHSKEVKINFHGYDIAIGISPLSISYNSGRRYRALTYKK